MNLLQSILMGIVQGLSEFLPISSSAHLVFTSNFYKVFNNIDISQHSNQEIFFDIMLHLGTLVAVLLYFKNDIFNIIKAIYLAIKTKNYNSNDFKIGCFIIIGTFVSFIVAYPLNKFSASLVFNPVIVSVLLLITGFILIYSEFLAKRYVNENPITLKKSIMIAIAQGLAALPGFSRSGLTIAMGMFLGLSRVVAARYSFLLSMPIILGASMFYPILELDFNEMSTYNWHAIVIGTIVSAVVGYLCIKYFMKFVSKFSLRIFGYYCLLFGLFTLVFFWGR